MVGCKLWIFAWTGLPQPTWMPHSADKHCPRDISARQAARRKGFPRVLWVDNIVPEVDRDSGSIRATWMLRILLDKGFAVTFQPQLERHAASDRKYGQQLRYYGVEVLPISMPSTWQLRDENGECLYDVFIISRPDNYRWAWPALSQACPGVPMIYDTVDLHFLREARVALMKGKGRHTALSCTVHPLSTTALLVRVDEHISQSAMLSLQLPGPVHGTSAKWMWHPFTIGCRVPMVAQTSTCGAGMSFT
jgi:hypothetical protein